MLALLTLLAALPAFSQDSSGWPLSVEESRRLGAEHARACEILTEKTSKAEALGTAYASAADPDAALRAWTEAYEEGIPVSQSVVALSVAHKNGLKATDMVIVMKAVGDPRRRTVTDARISPEYSEINRREGEMANLSGRVLRRHWSGKEVLEEAAAARAERRRRDAEERKLIAGVGGAALLAGLVAAAVWASHRPKRAADVQVIKLD